MPANAAAAPDRTAQIKVFFDPQNDPAVSAHPERVLVEPGEVVDIEWIQAGDNTNEWRFVFIGFMDPVGDEMEIEIPYVHPNGKTVTTRDTNKPSKPRLAASSEEDRVFRYKIYVREQRGQDRFTVWASDPEIVNQRQIGGGG